jgi:hypothetical protein
LEFLAALPSLRVTLSTSRGKLDLEDGDKAVSSGGDECMETRFYGLCEAARMIGVSPASLKYHLLFGRAGDVEHRAPNGSRLFTSGDVARLKTLLNPDREGARP